MPDKRRRELIKGSLLLGAGSGLSPPLVRAGLYRPAAPAPIKNGDASRFGYWRLRDELPEFVYTADQDALPEALWQPIDRPPTRRHFHLMGNRAIQVMVSNTGDIALFEESQGMRWLLYGDDVRGSGHSVIGEADGEQWGSRFSQRPAGVTPQRIFGPGYFCVAAAREGLALERAIFCVEGEEPWVLIRVRLSLAPGRPARRFEHCEHWQLRPRMLQTWRDEEALEQIAASIDYRVERRESALYASELFARPELAHGAPAELILQRLGQSTAPLELRIVAPEGGAGHPTLEARSQIELRGGENRTLWFRFGRNEGAAPADPEAFLDANQQAIRSRLVAARIPGQPALEQELRWHSAVLTGGANRDALLGGHTMNQASVYGFGLGANAAARDALQHALPLVYSEPELALSVLKNTCAWCSPDGDLPYALTAAKQPLTNLFRPSDQNLWLLWLAAEYAAATGDLAAFSEQQGFHPVYDAEPISLREHLLRQFRFFVDVVARGERNHVRILNADWNDMALEAEDIDRSAMIEGGSSVLNSAMASWVLSVFSPLMARLGEAAVATEAMELSRELRELVGESWNGRWFDRAYGPGGKIVGRERCWLEVQPWAILCGAAGPERAAGLLSLLNQRHRHDSPLGARIIWPPERDSKRVGQGVEGGIWYSINSTLVWAAAGIDPDLARDEWQRMSLHQHTRTYPSVWEGTLSGPDAWNAPEADRPGRTWSTPGFSMQAFPVNNLHAHGQPLLAYLRLLGVEPGSRGGLNLAKKSAIPGAQYHSRTFSLGADGHGSLLARGPVEIHRAGKTIRGAAGRVRF